ncbi:MAG: hypothetical protein VYA43_03095, partial [Pseudomonadota bacterium]|nr:hypothetical protein [Pseudomonadota bacterium]
SAKLTPLPYRKKLLKPFCLLQRKLFNEAICYENSIADWGHRLCCFEFFCIESAGSSPEAIR